MPTATRTEVPGHYHAVVSGRQKAFPIFDAVFPLLHSSLPALQLPGGCLCRPRSSVFLALENRMAPSLSELLQTATRAGIPPALTWLQPLQFSAQSRLSGNSKGAGVLFFHDTCNTKLEHSLLSHRASDGRFYGSVFQALPRCSAHQECNTRHWYNTP